MNSTPPDSPSPDAVARHGRSGRLRKLVVIGVIVSVAAVLVVRSVSAPRQSAVRLVTEISLRHVTQAAEIYQQQHQASPKLDDLIASGLVDVLMLDEFSRCEQPGGVGGIGPAINAWLVQTFPCRAVRKGEAYGGPGETTDVDIPACRFVLMHDWSVVQIEEGVYQRDYAPHVVLKPLR